MRNNLLMELNNIFYSITPNPDVDPRVERPWILKKNFFIHCQKKLFNYFLLIILNFHQPLNQYEQFTSYRIDYYFLYVQVTHQ